MARKAEEEANHWPGFVDVLSTIVMVVTFLLIILGIVIFVISDNISKELAASAQIVEESRKKVQEAQKSLDAALKKAEAAQMKSQNQGRNQGEATSQAQAANQAKAKSQSQNNAQISANVYRASLARELTQNVKIDGKDKHAIRTRKTLDTKQISIARTEKETNPRKVKVSTSTAVLSLLFNGGIKVTTVAAEQVQYYLKTTIYNEGAKYEIRSFYNTDKGSISEARRMAYYRALATRNQLLKLGIKASRIALKVGNSSRVEDAGKVNIYLK